MPFVYNIGLVGFRASVPGWLFLGGLVALEEAEAYVLLNPDTEVQPGALETLVQFMEAHPEAGVTGARLLNPDGTLQPSCHPFPTVGPRTGRLYRLIPLAASLARLMASPLAWLERPPQRRQHLVLAGHYRRLVRALVEI